MIVAEECVDYEDPGRSKENLHTFSKLWTDRVVCNGVDIVDDNDVDDVDDDDDDDDGCAKMRKPSSTF